MDKTCKQSIDIVNYVIKVTKTTHNDATLGAIIREYIREMDINEQGKNKKN